MTVAEMIETVLRPPLPVRFTGYDGSATGPEDATVTFHVARPPGLDRDVVLVQGLEPSMRWRAFTDELVGWVLEAGATEFVTLGALLADVPHTRPLPVTTTTNSMALQRRLDVSGGDYEGPTGIVGVLTDEARQHELPALSCWAAVPHYVSQPPNPKATVALLQRVEQVLEPGSVMVRISDDGPGIAPEDLSRVFERFYRADSSRTRETGGTGLGLSIVKHVAADHGGTVELWSTPGRGSTFTLVLPRLRTPEPQTAPGTGDREEAGDVVARTDGAPVAALAASPAQHRTVEGTTR